MHDSAWFSVWFSGWIGVVAAGCGGGGGDKGSTGSADTVGTGSTGDSAADTTTANDTTAAQDERGEDATGTSAADSTGPFPPDEGAEEDYETNGECGTAIGFATTRLAAGVVGAPYSSGIEYDCDNCEVDLHLRGVLPRGLEVSGAYGRTTLWIEGVPLTAGEFTLTVAVESLDGAPCGESDPYTLVITEP